MPKMKTCKSAAKRFKKTKKGHFKRNMAYGRHLMTGKSPKRRRRLRHSKILDSTDAAVLRRMMPYA
jgi:large subunit ribosomal protein L35